MSTARVASVNQNLIIRIIKHIWEEYSIILVTVFIFVVAGLIASRFLTFGNIMLVLRHSAIIGIIALGMTFVIVTGGIDLSAGHAVAMSGTILIMVQGNENNPLWLAVLACFGSATALGLVNGVIITKCRLPPFIVTLAVGAIARSLALYATGGVSVPGRRTPEFMNIGNG